MIKIVIQDIPSSNNVYQGQGSKSKAIRGYQGEKKLWNQYVWIMRRNMIERGELERNLKPLREATIIIKYYFPDNTRRDNDNYSGKMINDALVSNGFISDDSFKEIDLFPMGVFGTKEKKTEIYILEGKQISNYIEEMIRYGEKAKE